MSARAKIAQFFIIAVIAGVTMVLVAGVWKEKSRPVTHETPEACPPDAEMKLTDMEFTEMQQGKRFWTLCASEAKYFQDQQKTLLQTVHLTFYLDKSEEEIHVQSREGVLHAGTKDIELEGEIRAELPRDYVVTMAKAHYDHKNRIVQSDEPVHISGPGLEMDGARWEYEMADHVAKMGGKVRASLVIDKLRIEK